MIRVLVVDDSAVVRQVLSKSLGRAGDIEVVGTALDAFVARDKIVRLRPDVVTLDLEMPRMDGLTFLRKLMKHYPLPVIVVSSLTTRGSQAALQALEVGAVDIVPKPSAGAGVEQVIDTLIDKIRAAAQSRRVVPSDSPTPSPHTSAPPPLADPSECVLAIGASTGGTEAIKSVLLGLPADAPPTVIVQHLPGKFTRTFAQRLDELCLMTVREAQAGQAIAPGLALVAPGDRHMTVRTMGDRCIVDIKDGPPVFHQRPSVDVLFHSVARQVGPRAVGVLLTGMGADGARGLLAMRQAGAYTIAQDEATSVVYGMPREAARMDAAEKICPLPRISRHVLDAFARPRAHQPA